MNNDHQLIEDFVRIKEYSDVIVIFVGDIHWSGHEPSVEWVPLLALPIYTQPSKVQKQAASVLNRKRYFAVCQECAQRQPKGWMHDDDICHSCAEKQGVIY